MAAPAATTPITYQVPDSAIEITVHPTGVNLYRVATTESGFPVDEWSCTYATVGEARKVAYRVARIFKVHKSTAGVAQRRAESVRAADAEYDTLRDLHDRLGELLADVTAHLEAA